MNDFLSEYLKEVDKEKEESEKELRVKLLSF